MRQSTLLLVLAGVGGLLLAQAASADSGPGPSDTDPLTGITDAPQGLIPAGNGDDSIDWWSLFEDQNPDLFMGTFPASPYNLGAFLYMLRRCEHRSSDVATGDDYYTYYGGSRFSNTADHPVITGEKVGIPLDDLGPAYTGLVSTAAGAYQITRTTWAGKKTTDGYSGGVRDAGSWGPALPDFSPASQDEAARRILVQIGALPLIEAGDIAGAMAKASQRWASLPGSLAGQGGRDMNYALGAFNAALTG